MKNSKDMKREFLCQLRLSNELYLNLKKKNYTEKSSENLWEEESILKAHGHETRVELS